MHTNTFFYKFLFYANLVALKATKRHEPTVKMNLFTILGFKNGEDCENKIRKFIDKEIWQLYIDCLGKDVDHPKLKVVVLSIITNVARNCNGKAYGKINSTLLYKDQDSKEKAVQPREF
ncbi:hypothetical protein [Wolbachia endosymbiont of Ctenocephalides felis wCfeT]|uniref:hypothetical protein n=1 Tax=Wolbachia endosymbiont of Ctenocephalides felis wCfeT TaxID=2732593 RepID=UPI0014476950|nr:hypothetical protein [Wolbachia endosymbiont of Ctenocephalides felis wCfeT]